MNRKPMILAMIVLAFSVARSDQTSDTGSPPYGSVDVGQRHYINLQNLNVHADFPLVAVPGRRLDFAATLTYDSSLWRKVGTVWVPAVDSNGDPTWGWNLQALTGHIDR